MIGLGPHDMSTWLWVTSASVVVVFSALTVLAIVVCLRVSGNASTTSGRQRRNATALPVADARPEWTPGARRRP